MFAVVPLKPYLYIIATSSVFLSKYPGGTMKISAFKY